MSDEDRIYIPAYISAIAFTSEEGGAWIRWNIDNLGVVQSQHMPSGSRRTIGGITVQANYLSVINTYGGRIHAILFEGGYIWDCINGWRNIKIEDNVLSTIKQHLLFSE